MRLAPDFAFALALRVLCPRGKAFLGGSTLVKPLPGGIDDWSHPYHRPDNNPQSRDQVARAPYLTQFLAEPYYAPLPQAGVASAGPSLNRQDWRTNWRTAAYLKCSDKAFYFAGPTIGKLLAVSAVDARDGRRAGLSERLGRHRQGARREERRAPVEGLCVIESGKTHLDALELLVVVLDQRKERADLDHSHANLEAGRWGSRGSLFHARRNVRGAEAQTMNGVVGVPESGMEEKRRKVPTASAQRVVRRADIHQTSKVFRKTRHRAGAPCE